MYKDGEIQIVPVDPFHPQLGLLFPFLVQRMLDFAKIHYVGAEPEMQVREMAARMCMKDEEVQVLAFIAPDGKIVGHSVVVIFRAYGTAWGFILQCKLDVPGADTVERAKQAHMTFAKQHGAGSLRFETKRSDSAWAKAYGFKISRHVMTMDLNGKPEEVEVTKGGE